MKKPPEKSILKKLERLRRGHKPRVLDLFSGCGGISLGFNSAGFQIDAAVEIDPTAAETHARNFHSELSPELLAAHMKPRDLTQIEPDELTSALSLGTVEDSFDVVVGGPPCQAYARVGRAKLRDVADHPSAFKVDPRGNLYLRYLHFVEATQPLALLMENVPDAMNYGGHNVMAEVAEALNDLGYIARYSLINTAFHGVPQMRDRVFLIAYHRALNTEVHFPKATNHLVLPSGYAGTRAVALKYIDLFEKQCFVEADHGNPSLPGPVTTMDALGDLPSITLHLEGKLKRGARRFDEFIPYGPRTKFTAYARLMRKWQGFEAPGEGLRDHVIRYLPRDADIFRHMPSGGEYPAAHATAVKLWEKKIKQIERRLAKPVSKNDREALFAKMVPPYPVHNFPNRWWKLRPDAPSRTLLAHIGKDTYSHIHYDSAQARVISVREAARLQSFPDGFCFSGTMNPAYRQIGNAVPPIMAKRLAEKMMEALQGAAVPTLVAAE
ncbi:DNA cytosine methyltransferase [Bradyrhizobium sp. S69]|uniref:DNA cytosine methyltransferase n=1 Tax=Bradyrhizobium sp. S69 TaxID=1641856 RepID=UPI00131E49D9|nr:DNA cytosine methyltransferase [Bradyrhizobium sp. S69]